MLDILICTYGIEGLERITRMEHPRVEGVRYVVACQLPEGTVNIPDSLKRDDFEIVVSHTKGLSVNRNIALDASKAPLILIADDDIRYTEESIKEALKAFQENPDCGFLTFRFEGEGNLKQYPATVTGVGRKMPRNYHVTSFELGFRRGAIDVPLRFNEFFGIGAAFPLGEENLLVDALISAGVKGRFIPVTICRHEGYTTGNRIYADTRLIEAQGAVVSHLNPFTWIPRMLLFAWRGRNISGSLGMVSTVRAWLKGVVRARRKKAFSRPLHTACRYRRIYSGKSQKSSESEESEIWRKTTRQ